MYVPPPTCVYLPELDRRQLCVQALDSCVASVVRAYLCVCVRLCGFSVCVCVSLCVSVCVCLCSVCKCVCVCLCVNVYNRTLCVCVCERE